MTTYNTGNPIGSTDARDRLDNTENMDILENSTTLDSHPDRLGVLRKTRHGMEVEHDAQIAAHETEHDAQMQSFENDFDSRLAGMAFTRVGTFTAGATLTDMRQTLLWEVSQGGDGHEYGWTGSFLPSGKVVAAGATPATSGGIGAGAWVDRTDSTIRSDLLLDDGADNVKFKRSSLSDAISISLGDRVENSHLFDASECGIIPDGVTDFSLKLQTLINNIHTLYSVGVISIPFNGSLLRLGSSVIVREGITIDFNDHVRFERQNFKHGGVVVTGTSFVGDYIFALESNCAVLNCAKIYDDSQKYHLSSNTEAWNAGPIAFSLGYSGYDAFSGNNVCYGAKIKNAGFLGIKQAVVQHDSCFNVQHMEIDGLYGMPLEIGVFIKQAYDVIRVTNIHFNMNTYYGLIDIAGTDKNTVVKVAKNHVTLKLGRVDGLFGTNIFAYGIRFFLEFIKDAFTGDMNTGGSVSLTNVGMDAGNVMFKINRSHMDFAANNVVCVPVLKTGLDERGLVNFGSDSSYCLVSITNVKSFGGTLPALGDTTISNAPNYHFVFNTTGSNITVHADGGFANHATALTFGENTTTNNIVDFGSGSRNMHTQMTRTSSNGEFQIRTPGAGLRITQPNETTKSITINDESALVIEGIGRLGLKVGVPATATSAGYLGQWAADSTYLYICTATNVWRRCAIATW